MSADILELARLAGESGQSWNAFTDSDAVKYAAMAGDLDVDAIEASYQRGRLAYITATWLVVWTTAPEDYDAFGACTLETCGNWHGKQLRKVAIEPGSFVYQSSRYWFGLHSTWDEDPRVQEARAKEQFDRERATQAERDAKRAAGLEWLRTAAEIDLEDFDTFEAHGLRHADVHAELTRRDDEKASAERKAEWARCEAAIPVGATIIDVGVPASRGQYGVIPAVPAHIYYNVRIRRGWPDDVDHAYVMGDGNDSAWSPSFVVDHLATGRMRIAAPGEVPPRAVVQRIGHDRWKDIRRVEVDRRVVYVGSPMFGETLVLDERGHKVRSAKVVAKALEVKRSTPASCTREALLDAARCRKED